MTRQTADIEAPTIFLLAACYAAWGIGTVLLPGVSLALAVIVTALAITLHSSLCHEAIHGHPTRARWLNELLLFPALILVIPYGRFRDTHLDHHDDERLTDPYDDPETNYFDPRVWARLSSPMRALLRFNNTLLGRLTVGPALSLTLFLAGDLRAARSGDTRVLGDRPVGEVNLAVFIDSDVLEQGVTTDGVIDIGLALPIEIDRFGIASTFEVEDA